jgi:predicted ATPase
MRLDKLTIGSPSSHATHHFKNLKDVTIDFDQDHWVTVLIGWNGTGKSNVLEALAIIFRDLIQDEKKPAFAYKLSYCMGIGHTRKISIDADPERGSNAFIIHVKVSLGDDHEGASLESHNPEGALAGKVVARSAFLADAANLPRYVFSYYSGESTRMREVFQPYLEQYDRKLRGGEDPGTKRLFYAMPVHSQFVLLAFLIQQDEAVRDVLEKHLGLDGDEGLESVLFVLRQPPWKSRDGDPRFWNARGVVGEFLGRLYEVASAPIDVKRTVATSTWNKKKLGFKYLYVKDIAALRQLVGQRSPASFFRDLESTHVSELIDEVRIRVRLKGSDGTVTFRELSEGEQQFLTVLGLLRFTAEQESLFLLDEPDTHLNPRWSVDYLSYLRKCVGTSGQVESNSHIVLTTHNPMAVAELVKEQVQILRLQRDSGTRRVVACHPEMDPRGLGYAAIVASDMFGIASSLDAPTQLLLEQQRAFGAKEELTRDEQAKLDDVNAKLDRLGFRFFHPDDEYSRYLRLRNDALTAHFQVSDPGAVAARAVSMSRDEREELAAQLIQQVIEKEGLLRESKR